MERRDLNREIPSRLSRVSLGVSMLLYREPEPVAPEALFSHTVQTNLLVCVPCEQWFSFKQEVLKKKGQYGGVKAPRKGVGEGARSH